MKNIKFNFLNFMMLLIMLSIVGCTPKKDSDSKELAEDQNDTKFDNSKIKDDTEFAVKAVDNGMLKVQLGRLAQTKSSTSQVKILGQMMADDHGKSIDELKKLAAQKNITLPTVLSEDCQDTYNDLAAKTGKDFDEAYTDFMVKDHKENIDEFKKEADRGNDADLKSWAAGKVATLEHHLEMAKQAEELVDKMK